MDAAVCRTDVCYPSVGGSTGTAVLKFCEMRMHLSASWPLVRPTALSSGYYDRTPAAVKRGPIRARSPIPQLHGHGTSPMSTREPQRTEPKTLAMQSSRDMLEKLRREIDCLA